MANSMANNRGNVCRKNEIGDVRASVVFPRAKPTVSLDADQDGKWSSDPIEDSTQLYLLHFLPPLSTNATHMTV